MSNFFKTKTIKSLFRKDPAKDQLPQNSPLYTFQMVKRKRFTKSTHTFLFYEDCCLCYKSASLKKLKGLLTYSFELRVQFNSEKLSITLWLNTIIEEYICQHKEAFDSLKVYFSQRLNLMGFHETYTAIKKIGKGNFASVFLIENKLTGGLFAAKVFLKDIIFNEKKGKESIINEINIMRALRHENIIRLYEVYETNSSFYMILELLKGGNLGEYIKISSRFQTSEIVIIVKTLLSALKHCHSLKIMHRDIKPENILFRKEEIKEKNICIADFGLATSTTVDDFIYKKCGTPGFVAPEILKLDKFKPEKYGPACDLFSIGVLFHILLTGKQPFSAYSYNEMIDLNKHCNLDYDRVFYKSLPARALNLLQGLLDPDPCLRLTAEQALKHSYLTGVESVPGQVDTRNPEKDGIEWELKSEENCESEEELKMLANNMQSLRRMDKSCRMLEEVIRGTLKEKMSTLKESSAVIPLYEKKGSISWQETKLVRHDHPKCSIVIRVPAITGRINSIASPKHSPSQKMQESGDDCSPVLRKEIIKSKEQRKELNFTLLSCNQN